MAISHLIPELWAAALYRELRQQNVWSDTVTDISGETIIGNKINIGNLSTDPTVRDYAVGTALEAPEDATDAEKTLSLDQQKYFNIMIHDINEVQTRPNVMNDWSRKAGAKILETLDTHLYTTWSTGTVAAAQKISVASLKADLTETDAHIKTWVESLLKLSKIANDLKWPMEGRWCIVNTKGYFYLNKYLLTTGRIGTGETNQTALMDAMVMRMFGFRIRPSLAMSNADDAATIYAIAGLNSGVYFAQQISEIEAFRPESHFSDAVKGLYVYGSVLMDATRRMTIVKSA